MRLMWSGSRGRWGWSRREEGGGGKGGGCERIRFGSRRFFRYQNEGSAVVYFTSRLRKIETWRIIETTSYAIFRHHSLSRMT